MKRINVIGTSGSGKSTFGKRLADSLQVEYIEMDAVYWKENWGEPGDLEFFKKLTKAIENSAWVLDGNYSRTNTLKWGRADTIIWIDYSFFRTFLQILKRSAGRAWSKKEIWPGTMNRESFYKTFLTKESIILWMLTHYRTNKVRYSKLFSADEYNHLNRVRLKSPKEANKFIIEARNSLNQAMSSTDE